MEELLALGSVVKVQLTERNTMRFVIAGYFPHDKKTDKVYDYAAVLYPWGMQPGPAIQMFHHGQILSVEHPGYLDDDGREITKRLPEAFKQYAEEIRKVIRKAEEEKAETEADDFLADFG